MQKNLPESHLEIALGVISCRVQFLMVMKITEVLTVFQAVKFLRSASILSAKFVILKQIVVSIKVRLSG
jgi:hypothetical protein